MKFTGSKKMFMRTMNVKTQQELADKVGYGRNRVNKFLNNKVEVSEEFFKACSHFADVKQFFEEVSK